MSEIAGYHHAIEGIAAMQAQNEVLTKERDAARAECIALCSHGEKLALALDFYSASTRYTMLADEDAESPPVLMDEGAQARAALGRWNEALEKIEAPGPRDVVRLYQCPACPQKYPESWERCPSCETDGWRRDVGRLMSERDKAEAALPESCRVGDVEEGIRILRGTTTSLEVQVQQLVSRELKLRALVRDLRDAVVQRRLGPSLRSGGWMDREARVMQETESV